LTVKRFVAVAVALVAAVSLVAADVADAKRMGGGRTLGAQRSMPSAGAPSSPSVSPATPPGAASNPVMPAQPGSPNFAKPAAPAAAGAAAAAPAAAKTGMSRWLAPIAGIAAGLGLAALLSHFGLSETFATFLLIALVVVAGAFLVRMLFARRSATAPQAIRYAGATNPGTTIPKGYETSVPPSSGGARIEPAIGSASGATGRYPPGFDPVPFLAQAKSQFARVQAAYDTADRRALADVMTPEMFGEISRDIDARGTHVPTEIVSLEARIEDVTTEASEHWASVRFYGLLREDGAATPQSFDEVWNLVKPVDGSTGWLLAGIRQFETARS
jgi:predicted lipid-binding transport protein (Tim44 family)